MQILLIILLLAAMAATVVALVRGIIAFLQEQTAEVKGVPNAGALRSNKMMQARIVFQAVAVLLVVVILFAAGRT